MKSNWKNLFTPFWSESQKINKELKFVKVPKTQSAVLAAGD